MVILIICVCLNIILFALCIYLAYKYIKVKTLCNEANCDFLYTSSKLSMIEYYYRQYKEGKNPITTLRDIGNVIYSMFRRRLGDGEKD